MAGPYPELEEKLRPLADPLSPPRPGDWLAEHDEPGQTIAGYLEGPKKAREKGRGERFWVEVLGRPVPAVVTEGGIRAVRGRQPIDPDSVRSYLDDKFGDDLKAVRSAMQKLAKAYRPQELAHDAYRRYERSRPDIPAGKKGWGARGDLDLGLIGRLAKERS